MFVQGRGREEKTMYLYSLLFTMFLYFYQDTVHTAAAKLCLESADVMACT